MLEGRVPRGHPARAQRVSAEGSLGEPEAGAPPSRASPDPWGREPLSQVQLALFVLSVGNSWYGETEWKKRTGINFNLYKLYFVFCFSFPV